MPRVIKLVLGLVALAYAVTFLVVVGLRLGQPFALEWMEGGSLLQLQRLASGGTLYVAPSVDFIPFIYPPLYYVAAALVAKALGPGFAALRLVSVAASVGTAGLLAYLARRETGAWLPALLAAGLFLATYRHSGAWMDVGRVDALYVMLLVATLAVLRFAKTTRGLALAGIACALAYLTKQLAVAVALPMAAWAIALRRLRGLAFVAAAMAAGGLATWAVDAASGGWYRFYVFETLSQHRVAREMIVGFWSHDMGRYLAVAFAMAAVYLVDAWRRGEREAFWFWTLAGAGLVGTSYLSKLNFGGYDNVLMWADAWAAVMFALGVHAGARLLAGRPRLATAFGLVALLQFAMLAYDPRAQVPNAASVAAGRALVERLRAIPGPVWVPYHPELAVMAGKPPLAHGMALVELTWGTGPVVEGLRREVEASIAERRFGAIVLDDAWFPPELARAIAEAYPMVRPWSLAPFVPVTGMRTEPTRIYLR